MPDQERKPLRLAVLLSGGGTTLQNIQEHIDTGSLHARVVVVIASNDKAYGLTRASNLNLPNYVVPRKAYDDTQTFSKQIFHLIRDADADLVCLAGFLSLLAIPDDFAGKVVNIHPGLLPSFGGKGMHGKHVHQAVIDHGCKLSGCTVHYADQTYDTGPIIVQHACPVLEEDTAQTLAARVFEQECKAYPEAIGLIAEGRVSIEGRRTRIAPAGDAGA